MLKTILNWLFPQTQQPTAAVPDPKWAAYKSHLSAQRLRARREQTIGIVPALLEHVDREYWDGPGL